MKNANQKMGYSLLALSVHGALFAMFAMPAYAEDDELASLLKPTNTIEVGVASVSNSSAKYGQFTGMNKKGADFVGNFNLNGGDSYGDGAGVRRWSFTGKDVGLTSRSLGVAVKEQGTWNIGIGYDELQNNISDTYQTPYVGAAGGNSFALPVGFGVAANTNLMTAPQAATMHKVDISSNRKNASVTAGVVLNDQFSVQFDYNQLVQSGAKLAAFGSMGNAALAPGVSAEYVAMLPNPTSYKTDTVNLGLNWIGEQSHLSTSYFGSFFREGVDSVTFQTFAGANANQVMSTSPSNQLHQLNLNGGFKIAPQTQLNGAFSYGRNTQNAAYVTDAISMFTPPPQASLNGLVNTYHADLKLTDRTLKDLVLSAGVKYDKRDDLTASKMYAMNALDGSAAHIGYFANTPYSNSKTQLELAGDIRMTTEQNLRLAYNREQVKRWCNQYGTDWTGVTPVGMTTPGINSYPAGTNCVVATGSHDDKLSANYRMKATDDLNFNVGYSISRRVTTSDPNAVTARIGLNGNLNPAAGVRIQGQNAGDYRGFYPYFDASRKEQMLKANTNWQATEKLSLDFGGKITDDKYDSTYGVKKGSSWSVNLDANYAYNETASVSAYASQQQRQRDMTDLQVSPLAAATTATAARLNVPAGSTWSDTQKDTDTTIGVGAQKNGLMGSKLEIDGDLTYTLGKTSYITQLNYAGLTTGGLTCAAPILLSCGALPTVKNEVIQLKLTGKYSVDKQSKIAVAYIFQQMKSNDYYYNGLQSGLTPNQVMPTNQQSPNYNIHVVVVSYLLDF